MVDYSGLHIFWLVKNLLALPKLNGKEKEKYYGVYLVLKKHNSRMKFAMFSLKC